MIPIRLSEIDESVGGRTASSLGAAPHAEPNDRKVILFTFRTSYHF